jgi:hypothetical protein
VTAEEYGKLLNRIRNEVETASAAFYTAQEINRFALENSENYEKLNRDARFWNLQVFALQTAYLMGLGRLFDKRHGVHTIVELLKFTNENPGYFSKTALAERKRRISGGQKPGVIETSLEGIWQPKRDELRKFQEDLGPSLRIYRDRYETIRHNVFAHSGKDERLIADALSKTLLVEINMMFLDLLEIIDGLYALFDNGVKHERRTGPHHYEREIEQRTRDVLNRLG